ncbi:DnaJ domain-containing protein [Syncephalastrum racemosum]|uniref:DnaJ domain-containing protein n=1 Tax=Syncephalastrum racemosum TaxID=13706 RepID=A0A1X2HMK4_SYNRA|nr:DnaJ domain-containing protein [Syncephalastrum racemosum]
MQRTRLVDIILCAPDYYAVLGVSKDATPDELRRAYVQRSRQCHPDKFVPVYAPATEAFQLLSEAYNALSDGEGLQKGPGDKFDEALQRTFHEIKQDGLEGLARVLRQSVGPNTCLADAFDRLNEMMHLTREFLHEAESDLKQLHALQQMLYVTPYYNVLGRMRLYKAILQTVFNLSKRIM